MSDLSIREHAVLEAVWRCTSVNLNALEIQLEIPGDELAPVVRSLKTKGMLTLYSSARSEVATITRQGTEAVKEKRYR
jgi:hypothetical protein